MDAVDKLAAGTTPSPLVVDDGIAGIDPLAVLPVEIVATHILPRLTAQELASARLVSSSWSAACSDPSLYKCVELSLGLLELKYTQDRCDGSPGEWQGLGLDVVALDRFAAAPHVLAGAEMVRVDCMTYFPLPLDQLSWLVTAVPNLRGLDLQCAAPSATHLTIDLLPRTLRALTLGDLVDVHRKAPNGVGDAVAEAAEGSEEEERNEESPPPCSLDLLAEFTNLEMLGLGRVVLTTPQFDVTTAVPVGAWPNLQRIAIDHARLNLPAFLGALAAAPCASHLQALSCMCRSDLIDYSILRAFPALRELACMLNPAWQSQDDPGDVLSSLVHLVVLKACVSDGSPRQRRGRRGRPLRPEPSAFVESLLTGVPKLELLELSMAARGVAGPDWSWPPNLEGLTVDLAFDGAALRRLLDCCPSLLAVSVTKFDDAEALSVLEGLDRHLEIFEAGKSSRPSRPEMNAVLAGQAVVYGSGFSLKVPVTPDRPRVMYRDEGRRPPLFHVSDAPRITPQHRLRR